MYWKCSTLSEYYADYFSAFTAEQFGQILSNDSLIRTGLVRNRCVYVSKGHGVSIADSLFEVIKEETPWPYGEETLEQSNVQNPNRYLHDASPQGLERHNRSTSQSDHVCSNDNHHNHQEDHKTTSGDAYGIGSTALNVICNLSKSYYTDNDR